MKIHSEFVCQQCGYKSASFLGKCPNCGEWNSLVEQIAQEQKSESRIQQAEVELVRLAEVKSQKFPRIATGFLEFDRVLGGGIVPGSIVLIAGDPGIGKSTLLLQTAMVIARGPVSRFLPAPAKAGGGKPASKGSAALPLEAQRSGVGNPSTTATPRKMSIVNGQIDRKSTRLNSS